MLADRTPRRNGETAKGRNGERSPGLRLSVSPFLRFALLAALPLLFLRTSAVQAQPVEGTSPWIIVRGPVTTKTISDVRNQARRAVRGGRDRLVYEFDLQQERDFNACAGLADEILRAGRGDREENLPPVKTYGYLTKPVKGHAVLPVLACQTLYMGPSAALGDVSLGEAPVTGLDAAKYLQVATTNGGTGKPPALILKMLVSNLVVYKIGNEHKLKRDQVAEYKLGKDQAGEFGIDPKYVMTQEEENGQPLPVPNLDRGKVGLYPTAEAITLGLIVQNDRAQYDTWQKLARELGIRRRGDPLQGVRPVAGLIEIRGEVGRGTWESASRQIRRALGKEGVNCLIFEIESPGGNVADADNLAKEIQEAADGQHADSKDRPVLTIAYVPSRANGAAVFIALACHEIVLGPDAELGNCKDLISRDGHDTYRRRLADLGESQGRPAVLIQALLSPNLEVVRVERGAGADGPRPVVFMEKSEAEKAGLRGTFVKEAGEPLVFTTANALEWGIAQHKVDNLKELSARYGIEEVIRMRGDWLDMLVSTLTHPVATIFLVIVGFTCLILELKAPGLGLPAIVAAVCFILVFWAHSWLSRSVNALAILIFALGLILLGVELFILPGFGITGISGLVLLLLGLGLVVIHEWPQSSSEYARLGGWMGTFAVGLLASMFAAYTLARYLPSIPYANRLILPPPQEDTSDAGASLPLAQPPALLGAVGTAVTTLRPAGKARFDDELIDVVAEGHYIEAGARIQVIEIDGLRVVVKSV